MSTDGSVERAIDAHSRARRSPDALAQELDGETVIMDLASESYFGLNETGTFVWKLLDGEPTVAELVDRLAEVYEASREELMQDCLELLSTLLDAGLVELMPGDATG